MPGPMIVQEQLHKYPNPASSLIDANTPARQRFNEIYYAIRRRITLLQYPPGKRLDIENLAAEFKVSRTPIRSVLQRLEYQGLVATRHGVGTLVTAIDFAGINEANQFRLKLAELIGDLSPRKPDARVMERLDDAIARLRAVRSKEDLEEFARIDILVHECNLGLIGNSQLSQSYDELYYRTARMWFYFLPKMNWRSETGYFISDLLTRQEALKMEDVKAYGYMIRNAISASIIRLQSLIPDESQNTGNGYQR